MLKLNHFFRLLSLMIVALLVGVLGGAQAKQAPPNADPNSPIIGPATVGTMIFFVGGGVEKVTFVGRCGKNFVNETINFGWKKAGSPALAPTDLVDHLVDPPFHQVFLVPAGNLRDAAQACYRTDATVIVLRFQAVGNFTEVEPDEHYSATVTLLRLTDPAL